MSGLTVISSVLGATQEAVNVAEVSSTHVIPKNYTSVVVGLSKIVKFNHKQIITLNIK